MANTMRTDFRSANDRGRIPPTAWWAPHENAGTAPHAMDIDAVACLFSKIIYPATQTPIDSSLGSALSLYIATAIEHPCLFAKYPVRISLLMAKATFMATFMATITESANSNTAAPSLSGTQSTARNPLPASSLAAQRYR